MCLAAALVLAAEERLELKLLAVAVAVAGGREEGKRESLNVFMK